MAYSAQGKHEPATSAYAKAIEAKSGNLDAVFQLGMAYVELGDRANATKVLEDFIKQASANKTLSSKVDAARKRLSKIATN